MRANRPQKNLAKKPSLALLALLAILLAAMPAVGAYASAGDGGIKPDETAPIETDGATPIVGISAELKPDETAPIETDGGTAIVGIKGELEQPGMLQDSAAFWKKSGKVSLIDTWNDLPFVRVADADGGETDFTFVSGETVVSDLTGLKDFSAVKTGAEIDAYYIQPPFMTLQYPARFDAAVLVVRNEGNPGAAFVGIVGDDGLASDGSIKLNISGDTKITRQSDGAAFKGGIEKRAVIAYYAVTSRSLPPQALVTQAVVLDKSGVPVFVNGKRLQNAAARVKPDGTVIAPLRAIVEALGHTVTWDDATQSARVGVAIVVTIGSSDYLVGKAAPIKLDAAAELINNRTYAPVSFYESILDLKLDSSSGLLLFSE